MLGWKDLGTPFCQSEHVGKNLLCAVKAEAGRSPVDYATLGTACRFPPTKPAGSMRVSQPLHRCAQPMYVQSGEPITHYPYNSLAQAGVGTEEGWRSKWTQVCTAAKQK